MNTEQIYAKLVARGMPEHPRLYIREDYGMFAAVDGGVEGYLYHDPDARDLITMHALRWAIGICTDADQRRGRLERVIAYMDEGDMDMLEAIEAATRHLDAKENA